MAKKKVENLDSEFNKLTPDQKKRLDNFKPFGFNKEGIVLGKDIKLGPEDKTFIKKQATIKKEAQTFSLDALTFGISGVPRIPLSFVDPLMDPVLLIFPKDNLVELNKRLRHYYVYHDLVGNIIDLHSEFPLSDFSLELDDPTIKEYYNDFKERIGLLEIMQQMLREYYVLGESIFYGNWDVNNYEWEEFNQYPPEHVEIKNTFISKDQFFYLKVEDDELKNLFHQSDAASKALVKFLENTNPEFVKAVKSGKPYLLDTSRVIYFANKPSKYFKRGMSILKRVLKWLLQETRLVATIQAFTERHVRPIKIFKIGSKEWGWIPSQQQFKDFQRLLVAAANDPDFNIIYHPFIEVEYVGTTEKIADIKRELDFTEKRIMTGLFANDALLRGETTTYASSTVILKILLFRYLTIRSKLEKIVKFKIFLPLAIKRGFIKRSQAELKHNAYVDKLKDKKLADLILNGNKIPPDLVDLEYYENTGIVRIANKVKASYDIHKYQIPSFGWQKRNLLSIDSERNFLMQLYNNGKIPFEMICDLFGWDSKKIKQMLKNEEATVFDVEWQKYKEELLNSDPRFKEFYLSGKKFDEILKLKKEIEELEKKLEEQKEQKELSKVPSGIRIKTPFKEIEEKEFSFKPELEKEPKPLGEGEIKPPSAEIKEENLEKEK